MTAFAILYSATWDLPMNSPSSGLHRPWGPLPSNRIVRFETSGGYSNSKSPLAARASTFAFARSSAVIKVTPSLWVFDSLLNSKIASLNTRSHTALPMEASNPIVSWPFFLMSSGHGTFDGSLSPAIAHLPIAMRALQPREAIAYRVGAQPLGLVGLDSTADHEREIL